MPAELEDALVLEGIARRYHCPVWEAAKAPLWVLTHMGTVGYWEELNRPIVPQEDILFGQ